MTSLEIIEFMAENDVTVTEADVAMIAKYRRGPKQICQYFMSRKNLYNTRNREKWVPPAMAEQDTWE